MPRLMKRLFIVNFLYMHSSINGMNSDENAYIQAIKELEKSWLSLNHQISQNSAVSSIHKRKNLPEDSDPDSDSDYDYHDSDSESGSESSLDEIKNPPKRAKRPEHDNQASKRGKECAICHAFIIGKMTSHLYTHTNEKPYQCSQCPYTSAQGANCRRHIINKHSSDLKPFIIETLKSGEMKIISVDYPEPKFCIHCKKLFYENYDHKRHQSNCKKKPK